MIPMRMTSACQILLRRTRRGAPPPHDAFNLIQLDTSFHQNLGYILSNPNFTSPSLYILHDRRHELLPVLPNAKVKYQLPLPALVFTGNEKRVDTSVEAVKAFDGWTKEVRSGKIVDVRCSIDDGDGNCAGRGRDIEG